MADDTEVEKLYRREIQSARWRKTRRAKLSIYPLCERCMSEGRTRAATEVHHVVPVQDAMDCTSARSLMFDPHNLRALCHECHILTHKEMGRAGRMNNQRRQAARLKEFRRRFLGEHEAAAISDKDVQSVTGAT